MALLIQHEPVLGGIGDCDNAADSAAAIEEFFAGFLVYVAARTIHSREEQIFLGFKRVNAHLLKA